MNEEVKFDDNERSDIMDLMSRTLAVYGSEVMSQLLEMSVLIVGLKGVGIEVAKNLALAGPGSITLYDNNAVNICDLSTNFYLTENDIGKCRADVCMNKISQLNEYVNVSVHKGEINENFLSLFSAVVFTDESIDRDTLVRYNNFCRNYKKQRRNQKTNELEYVLAPIAFIWTFSFGISCSVFTDFGPQHTVKDANGNPIRRCVIQHVDDKNDLVMFEKNHGLDSTDCVIFENLRNCNEKTIGPIAIKSLKAKQFQLDFESTPNINREYVLNILSNGGGICCQVKSPQTCHFNSLEEQITKPSLSMWMDMSRIGANLTSQHHIAQMAIWDFRQQTGHLPRLHNINDAKLCIELAHKRIEYLKQNNLSLSNEFDDDIVEKLALFAQTEFCGMTSFVGGIAAQEVMKLPGKFTPLNQWFHFSELSLISKDIINNNNNIPKNTRYDHLYSLFGYDIVNKWQNERWFLVGSGALGCEYLKGLALLGVGIQSNDGVYITDMDTVEVSNLSRQFLFRRNNVGQYKSVAASKAVNEMNKHFKTKAYEVAVQPKTENVFNDAFWDNLNGVINALDNVKARLYTCGKCVFHKKPLLESGTLGAMANSEVILPYQTDIYNQREGGDEDSIPSCTLHNFPYFIEHCITWAQARFNTLFTEDPQILVSFINDRDNLYKNLPNDGNATVQYKKLNTIKCLGEFSLSSPSIEGCVDLAVKEFHLYFYTKIRDLLHLLPPDAKTSEGAMFWTSPKRCPDYLKLDLDNSLHVEFITAVANLYAHMFGIPLVRDRSVIKEMAATIALPQWQPSNNLVTENNNESKETNVSDTDRSDEDVQNLMKELAQWNVNEMVKPKVAEFEKDHDDNFHIDFIAACANLRASNYDIENATRIQVKLIAGKIIPALATTTAMITGFNLLEYVKIIMNKPKVEHLNCNICIGVNTYVAFEPNDPPKTVSKDFDPILGGAVVAVPEGFSIWDTIVIDQGDLTLKEFLDKFPGIHHNCVASTIAAKVNDSGRVMYSSFVFNERMKKNQEANMPRFLQDVYVNMYGELSSDQQNYLVLDVLAETAAGDDAIIPPVKYIFQTPPKKSN